MIGLSSRCVVSLSQLKRFRIIRSEHPSTIKLRMRFTFPIAPEAPFSFALPVHPTQHPTSNMTQTMGMFQLAYLPPPTVSPVDSQSTLSTTSTTSSRRTGTRKEGQFVFKHGQRHHGYDNEKAPYPLSYERSVLELSVLTSLCLSPSFMPES